MVALRLYQKITKLEYGNKIVLVFFLFCRTFSSEKVKAEKLKDFIYMNLSTRRVCDVIYQLSRDNNDFLIPDLAKLVMSYIYEPPSRCAKVMSNGVASDKIIELKDKCLAVAREDGSIDIWDRLIGKCLQNFKISDSSIGLLAELADKCIVAGTDDGEIKICNRQTGTLATLGPFVCGSITCATELDDKNIAFTALDDKLRIWNRQSESYSKIFKAPSSFIFKLKTGNIVSAGYHDGRLKILDIKTGDCLKELNTSICAPVINVFELNDEQIAFAFHGNGIFIWNTKTNIWHVEISASIYACDMLKDGSFVYLLNNDHCIKTNSLMLDIVMGKQDLRFTAICALSDGCIATASYDGNIRVWE